MGSEKPKNSITSTVYLKVVTLKCMARSDFHEYVVNDVFADIDGITSRAMFGGYGLYKDGIIFGIIADDVLYLKVDDTNQKDYESFGSNPFVYKGKNAKKITMSYWVIPETVLEDREHIEALVLTSFKINEKKKRRG